MADVFSYNLVMLIGRCCLDPELKEITDGKTLVKFSMATNEIYYGGEKHVEFHPIVIFGEKKGEFILKHLKKGMLLTVKGKLKHKTVLQRNNLKKTYTNVVADDVILLDRWTKKEEKEEDKPGSKEAPF